jgi:hypothetical protein
MDARQASAEVDREVKLSKTVFVLDSVGPQLVWMVP